MWKVRNVYSCKGTSIRIFLLLKNSTILAFIFGISTTFFSVPDRKKRILIFARTNRRRRVLQSSYPRIHLDLQLYPVINLAIVLWTWDKFCSKYLYFIFEPSYESKQHALQLPIIQNKYEYHLYKYEVLL